MDPTLPPPTDPNTYFSNLSRLKRIAVRLLPTAAARPLALSASKIGGMLAWPKAEAWPAGKGSRFTPVIQLRRDEYPEISFPANTDLFQVLWPPSFGALFAGRDPKGNQLVTATVRWRKLLPEDQCLPAPPALRAEPGYAPAECELHPERVTEYPSSFDQVFPPSFEWSQFPLPAEWRDMYDNSFRLFWDEELARAPGTKVLGWGFWVQDGLFPPACDSCGSKMTLLLSIASASVELLNIRSRWGNPYRANRLEKSTGLELASSGYVYFHYCTTCPTRPVVTTIQYS